MGTDVPVLPDTAHDSSSTDSHVVAIYVTFGFATSGLMVLILGSASSRSLLAATALTVCAIVTFPLIMRKSQFISSWGIFAVATYITVGLRTIYIVIGYPNDQTVSRLFTLGKSLDTFLTPSIWLAGFLFLLSCGYVVAQGLSDANSELSFFHHELSQREENVLVIALALLGATGLIMFVAKSGGIETLSAKRNLIAIADIGVDVDYRSYGHWRYLQHCSAVALTLYVVTKGRTAFRATQWLCIGLLYGLSISLPIYSNSRTQVVFITAALVAYFFLRYRSLASRSMLIGLLGVFLLFQVLSTFRAQPDVSQSRLVDEIATSNPIDTVVLTRNLVSLPRNAHTWHAVDGGALELKHGETMVSWIYGWIPRAIWRSKPAVHSGAELGPVIYGDEVGGAPPGLPAESFWNFGFLGGLLVAPLAGLALGAVDTRLRPHERSGSELQLGVYLLGVLPLATRIIGDSVTQAVLDVGGDIVIIGVALLAVSVARTLNPAK